MFQVEPGIDRAAQWSRPCRRVATSRASWRSDSAGGTAGDAPGQRPALATSRAGSPGPGRTPAVRGRVPARPARGRRRVALTFQRGGRISVAWTSLSSFRCAGDGRAGGAAGPSGPTMSRSNPAAHHCLTAVSSLSEGTNEGSRNAADRRAVLFRRQQPRQEMHRVVSPARRPRPALRSRPPSGTAR